MQGVYPLHLNGRATPGGPKGLHSGPMNPYDLINLGLAMDLAGAFALAKGFMLKRPADIQREAAAHLNQNSFLVRSGLVQTGEAYVGCAYLVTGFLLQMWANLHGAPAENNLGWVDSPPRILLVILLVGLTEGVFLKVAHNWSREKFWRLFFGTYDPASPPGPFKPTDGYDWDGLALLYDTKRRHGENDEDLRRRLDGLRKVLGTRYSQIKTS